MTRYLAAPRDTTNGITTGQPDRARAGLRFAATALVLLAILAYVNTLFHPFLYDDLALVLKNPEIRSLSSVPHLVGFRETGFELVPRWTRDLAYALLYAIAGPWPAIFRLANILLHAAAGLLVFRLLSRMSGDRLLAWWAAALFVLHPLGTDVVSQVSGLREILATIFALSALVLLQGRTEGTGAWRVAAALLCLYLGVYSKEMAIMAPLAFVLVELYRRREAGGGGGARAESLREGVARALTDRKGLVGVFLLAMVALVGMRLFLSDGGEGLEGSPSYYESSGAPLTAVDRLRLAGMGIRLFALPLGLSVDYSFDALSLTEPGFRALELVDLAVLGLGALVTAWGLYRRSWAGFAGAWFFLFYLPTSGVIPWHEIFAERFLYLPSIGLCAVAAAGIVGLQRASRRRGFALALATAVLGACAVGTVARNETWSTGEKLWSSAVERFPSCARARKALADQYLAGERPDLALVQYREAVRILPPYRDAHVGVGAALMAQGRSEEALAAFEDVLRRWPEESKALNNLGILLEAMGRMDEALEAFERAARSAPGLAEPYNNMGRLHAMRGDFAEAVRLCELALLRDPSLLAAIRNLSSIYRYGLRDESRAAQFDRRALELLAVR